LLEVTVLLINCGVKVDAKNQRGETALHLATRRNLLDCSRALLNAGCDVNITDNDAKTPLHVVTSLEMVKLLLEYGANVNVYDFLKNVYRNIL